MVTICFPNRRKSHLWAPLVPPTSQPVFRGKEGYRKDGEKRADLEDGGQVS